MNNLIKSLTGLVDPYLIFDRRIVKLSATVCQKYFIWGFIV